MNHNWSEEARERGSRDEHPTETMGQSSAATAANLGLTILV